MDLCRQIYQIKNKHNRCIYYILSVINIWIYFVEPTCPVLSVHKGRVFYSRSGGNEYGDNLRLRVDTVATHQCNSGWKKKSGWRVRRCQNDGRWDGYSYRCKRSKNFKAKHFKLSCMLSFCMYVCVFLCLSVCLSVHVSLTTWNETKYWMYWRYTFILCVCLSICVSEFRKRLPHANFLML